jgi:methionyl-tRNA formyltransferase
MQMDAGLDTGDILLMEQLTIEAKDTTACLHDRLATMGARMLVQALAAAEQQTLHPQPQPDAGVTYAHKIDKVESTIDWTQPASTIARRIRAFDPFPGASTTMQGEVMKVWGCEIDSILSNTDKREGAILNVKTEGISVACGNGVLRLTVLQRPGGRRLPAADFLRGFPLEVGMILGGSHAAS